MRGDHPIWRTVHAAVLTLVSTGCLLLLLRALAENPSTNETLAALVGGPGIIALTKLFDRIGPSA